MLDNLRVIEEGDRRWARVLLAEGVVPRKAIVKGLC